MPNFIKISHTVAEIWRFNGFFQKGGHSPSWIRWARIETTHNDYFLVSVGVLNLVEIYAVDLVI